MAAQEASTDEQLELPLRDDGLGYRLVDMYPDQREILAIVLSKLREWLECDDLTQFEPLRMIINGSGGSGKSVVINTLVTCMRIMFDCNGVVRVAAPTGTAAFNVGGDTLHRLGELRVSGVGRGGPVVGERRKRLVKKFGCLLALIIDERSLVNSKDLGDLECAVSGSIFNGNGIAAHKWGGLPILLMVGDDFQLPGVSEGALSALTSTSKCKLAANGREALVECSKHVRVLTSNKRVQEGRQPDIDLMAKLRTGSDLSEDEVQRLLNLHVDSFRRRHGGEALKQIEEDAVYLFYTNEKRVRHNLERATHAASEANPVAVLRPQCVGGSRGKGEAGHFDSSLPGASMLFLGARVAIEAKNYNPRWGLHSGACGVVDEIVFAPGHNPNHGHLPLYVVVDFPLYCGPPWDLDRPTVSFDGSWRLFRFVCGAAPNQAAVRAHPRHGALLSAPVKVLHQAVPAVDPCLRSHSAQVSGSHGRARRQRQDR